MPNDDLRTAHKLDLYVTQLEDSLVVKARADSLDEIRYQAGFIAGVRAVINMLMEEKDGQ